MGVAGESMNGSIASRTPRRAAIASHSARMSSHHGVADHVVGRARVEGEVDPGRNHVDGARPHLRDADGRDRVGARRARCARRRRSSRRPPRARRGAWPIGTVPAWPASPVTCARARVMPLMADDDADGQVLGLEQRPLLDMDLEIGAVAPPGRARARRSRPGSPPKATSASRRRSRRRCPARRARRGRSGRRGPARSRGWSGSARSPRRRRRPPRSGAARRTPSARSASTATMPSTTPRLPSKRPASTTLSICEPTRIAGASGSGALRGGRRRCRPRRSRRRGPASRMMPERSPRRRAGGPATGRGA